MSDLVVGVLGGGQLGRMLVEAAHRLEVKVGVLDSENAPAKQTNSVATDFHVTGSFAKASDVRALASKCDILTFEIEHVDTKVLEELDEERPTLPNSPWSRIQPSWRTVRTIQDKYAQKQHLSRFGIPTAQSVAVGTSHPQGLKEIADKLGYPLMLKSRTEAYDGRGNYPVKSVSDIEPALQTLADRPLYAEKWAHFKMELAVMVVKTVQESYDTSKWNASAASEQEEPWAHAIFAYPAVETIHEDSICKLVYAPARGLTPVVLAAAKSLATAAVASFAGTGVFGVEMFLLEDDELIVNEIAPRPHNSGHYTIEACHMSQYEAHLRAILPELAVTITPGSTDLATSSTNAVMLNILGGPHPDSHKLVAQAAMKIPGAHVHLYGKGAGRPGRKMGHITILGSTPSECESKIHPLVCWVDAIRKHRSDTSMSPEASTAAIISTAEKLISTSSAPEPSPLIAVCMGSDTDLATLKPGLIILERLKQEAGIPYEVRITSAHRTPQFMIDYGEAAAARGIKVIIAAAGGAAHLPGMMASSTSVPVVGVPVKASAFDGEDSLHSIVSMPRGIPVGTMGVGNSTNAALYAARIVGDFVPSARRWVEKHLKDMEVENMAKDSRLVKEGWQVYKKVDGLVERGSLK